VRDLLAGQPWFDLHQYRMDPPEGALMHWSRLIDAPVAALIVAGDFLGIGEAFALTAWPLLLLFAFLSGVTLTATALAGRQAAAPTLILSLLFIDPLLSFLPNDIDHHNAQYALLALTLAALLRFDVLRWAPLAVGIACGLMMAIALEMLPYLAVIASLIALLWALKARSCAGVALFATGFAVTPTLLYFATASPQARFACDSLSLAHAAPAAVAGFGLVALAVVFGDRGGAVARLGGLAMLAIVTAGTVVVVAPECVASPYGSLLPELKALWLSTILEAQPLPLYAIREPIGAIATAGPPCVALAIAACRLWSGSDARLDAWIFPFALLATALAISFYQVRTIPFANTIAIPIFGAWLATFTTRRGITSLWPLKHSLPLLARFALAVPLLYLAFGWLIVSAASFAGGGSFAPPDRNEPTNLSSTGMSEAERNCLDAESAILLQSVSAGLLLTPVFYGPAALLLSGHSVVAGPYHRAGAAILDSIHAMRLPADQAKVIIERRGIDYVAICATSRESGLAMSKAPEGLLAQLLSGSPPAWLTPVTAREESSLRLWRVRS
jgi:hypothetical protein